MVIARADLRRVLGDWVAGRSDAVTVWEWAQKAKQAGEPEDLLVRDIVDVLEGLPHDLVLEEDALVMLDALDNPSDEVDLGANLLWNYMDGIDQDARRYALSQHEFYGPFCDLPR